MSGPFVPYIAGDTWSTLFYSSHCHCTGFAVLAPVGVLEYLFFSIWLFANLSEKKSSFVNYFLFILFL
jgi:hypothetical protein